MEEDQWSCCDRNDGMQPLEGTSFELLEYLNSAINSGLTKVKKLVDGHVVNVDTPPDVTRRIVETDGNVNNDYYTYLNDQNNSNANHDPKINAPWKKHPYYFQTVNVSLLAMLKMSAHAVSGGSIEIMGMLVGYHKGSELVVLDCYPLPVQGTESRVNPQNDSYEFMLSFLTKLQESGLKKENIVGWYHSHPGFGCWLSGIDVQTQKLHQGFEDPYVAIVVDPIKSLKNGLVDIGAFRTLYDDHLRHDKNNINASNADLGWHGREYYALNVKVFVNEYDRAMLRKFSGVNLYSGLVVGERGNQDDDEGNAMTGTGDANANQDRDYDAIKLWKRFNKMSNTVSLNNAKTRTRSDELLESSISIDSEDTDAKITTTSTGGGGAGLGPNIMGSHKHTTLGENMNMTVTTAETAGSVMSDADASRLDLEKLSVEMDIVAAEEVKRFLVKNIQRGLFE